jgi:toxin FitB
LSSIAAAIWGVELARSRDAGKAAALERWLREIEVAFDGRVLGIDSAIRPIPVLV